MEFWGIEIKPGSPLKVKPEDGYLIHVSEIALSEADKLNDGRVLVYVKAGDDEKKLVFGNLSKNIPQVCLDIMFEKEFEVSHDCETTSVFLLGYKTYNIGAHDDYEEDDSDEEGVVPMDMPKRGEAEAEDADDDSHEKEEVVSSEEEEDESSDESDGDDYSGYEKVELPTKKATVTPIQQKPSVQGKKSVRCQCPPSKKVC